MRVLPEAEVAVSIVVPAHNAAHTLPACICALLKQDLTQPYEIIVVDDGSTDETASLGSLCARRVRVLRQERKGPAAARNRGIREACGRVVLFTDADCEPMAGWASALVRALDGGAAGAKGTYRTRQRSI